MKALVRILCLAAAGSLSGPLFAQDDTAAVVETAAVEQIELSPTIPVNANVFSRDDVVLTAAVAGELVWIAEAGSRIGRGEFVARLDETPLTLRREEQQSLLELEGVNQSYQSKEAERLLTLRESQNVSVYQLDEALARRDTSRKQMAVIASRIRQIDDEIERSRIRARFDGVLVERLRQAGEYVVPGDPVGRFVDVDRLEIRAAVPVGYRARLSEGGPIRLLLSDEEQHEAVIRTLIPAADPVSQTFEVRIDPPDALRARLTPGQLLKVSFPVETVRASLAVPRDAILIRREGNFVFRVNGDAIAERIPITIGEGHGALVTVEGDVRAGDRVVIRGADRLQHGQKVRERS